MDYSKSPTLANHVENQQLKGVLYHYTSGTGLKGILSNRELWMTNTLYLNDHQEMKHLGNVANTVVNELLEKEDLSENEHAFLEIMRSKEIAFDNCYYIGSFSEDGDSLPQWRGYCPDTGGFALGIPAKNLQKVVELTNQVFSQDEDVLYSSNSDTSQKMAAKKRMLKEIGPNYKFYLVKCIYDEKEQRQIAEEIIQYYLNQFKDMLGGAKYDESRRIYFDMAINRVIVNYHKYLEKVSAVVKHKSFKDEREWRIISPKVDVLSPDIDKLRGDHLPYIDFRETSRGLISYYKFNLGDRKDRLIEAVTDDLSKVNVVCGPSTNKVGAKEAALTMLRKYGFGPLVSESEVPYKTW